MTIGRWRITPTASSPAVAELRRLLIEPSRLNRVNRTDRLIALNNEEQHYLRRVLRLRSGDPLTVIDGAGHRWTAQLKGAAELALSSPLDRPQESQSVPCPPLGLALALVRRGMEDAVRMGCELGIDRFQPLRMARCTPQAEHRPERWRTVLREATEQCERLWCPELLALQDLRGWDPGNESRVAFGVARRQGIRTDQDWLTSLSDSKHPVWLVIGPEGGWTDAEIELAESLGWQPVSFGDDILRSSTASLRAAVSMVRWREQMQFSF